MKSELRMRVSCPPGESEPRGGMHRASDSGGRSRACLPAPWHHRRANRSDPTAFEAALEALSGRGLVPRSCARPRPGTVRRIAVKSCSSVFNRPDLPKVSSDVAPRLSTRELAESGPTFKGSKASRRIAAENCSNDHNTPIFN